MSDPRRFDEGEATEFERQLFEAANQQVPSAALKARMRQGLGLPAAPAPAPVAAKAFALGWKAGLFVGLVVIGASATALLVAKDRRQARPADTARSVSETLPPEAQATPAAPARGGSLTDEIHLLDRARAALASGDHRRALDVLGQYDDRYPQGRFGPEAVALRVEALSAAGDTQAARILGQQFLAQHPTNPLADRVAKIVRR